MHFTRKICDSQLSKRSRWLTENCWYYESAHQLYKWWYKKEKKNVLFTRSDEICFYRVQTCPFNFDFKLIKLFFLCIKNTLNDGEKKIIITNKLWVNQSSVTP